MKVGHTVANCWYMYYEDFMSDNRVAGMASTSTAVDPNWYLNSGTTDHITGELETLTMHEPYNGNDQIRVMNDAGMDIVHVGKNYYARSHPTPSSKSCAPCS
jgi:hypothetical protein